VGSEELANLAKAGILDRVPVSQERVTRLLSSAEARLGDARRAQNTAETRFECAYTAIRLIADAALLGRGYRAPSSRPGHHQTALQCLTHTLSIDTKIIRVLDALRKQRNLCDYEGDTVSEQMVAECIAQAQALLRIARSRLFHAEG
jgi:hypothetical protein